MTASPDPHVGLPSEETIARAMLDTGLNIGASTWPDEQFRDAQEIARAILSLIRPAFEAREREAHVLRAGLNREREAHRETIRQMAAINEAAEAKLAQAVEEERGACAQIVYDMLAAWGDYGWRFQAGELQEAIRARSASAAARGEAE